MHVSESRATRVDRFTRHRWARVRPLLNGDGPAGSLALVVALTGLGMALRLAVAGQSLFADELSTYWIVSTNGLSGVVSTVHTDAEISPPLYFVAAWLTTRIDLAPELLRAPSLLAGGAAIPLTYLLGLRTVGRGAALVASTLTALSPFMIFYSAEARGYELAIALVLLSTLALLTAAEDGGRARWWVVYAACSCAAVYTHYTTVFALGAQLLWVLWAHPRSRRSALVANAGAVVAFLPWMTGLIRDFRSPTTDILDALSPLSLDTVRISLEHWSVGYPYAFPNTALRYFPGVPGLVLLVLGVGIGILGVFAVNRSGGRRDFLLAHLDRRWLLVLALALATPLGELLVSLVGTNLLGTRNLAVSWPAFSVLLAAVVSTGPGRLRTAASALVIASFAIGAVRMLEPRFQRPEYEGVARLIDRTAVPGDVVIDGAKISPGPVTGLDAALDRPHDILRVGMPQQRDHPFALSDPVPPVEDVASQAVATSGGRRIFVVSSDALSAAGAPPERPLADRIVAALPPSYRLTETRTYPGILGLTVLVYAQRTSPGR